ncbi:efflux RND transporter periplasmic adaptor subunit [Methyloceanibacter caenitepidi]|uniref:efflux RND transporter periplasmic adaptor subunit n=1 Tax=Methyloceanibacter caenitepidi TaxID=1384459 RepID=UPI0009E5BF9E|nr:efflux RND transporter periplasmic adaptor subunit [Methyloceanibacter caenitepidi]
MGQWGRVAGVIKALLVLALPLFVSACSDGKEAAKTNQPLPGVVAEVVTEKEVSDETTFVGQTRSSQSVDIQARVKGTLLERPFEEGREVKEGAVLYKIDPSQFEADLLSAKATLAKAQASSDEKNLTLARYQALVDKNSPGVSEAQYDIALSQAKQADAEVSAGKADVANAKLNLGYATITSPLNGRAGISAVDVGNIIGPESGVLVTVVALDPIEVDFSVGERVYLNYVEAKEAGTAKDFTPRIRLANGKLYPHTGRVYVVNNEVDPTTGTIAIRLKFPNPDRLLLPGQYVTVLLTDAKPEKQVVVPQAAVQQNQSGPFVLVVDSNDQVQSRAIKTGQRVGTGIVVTEGLVPGQTIVVDGIQKVRPGAKVKVTYQNPSGTAQNVESEPAAAGSDDSSGGQASDDQGASAESGSAATGGGKSAETKDAKAKDTKTEDTKSEAAQPDTSSKPSEKPSGDTDGKASEADAADKDAAPASSSDAGKDETTDTNTEAKQ